METVNIPDKVYFRIGEVCDIVGIKSSVLRYWETEFSEIDPSKTSGGLRLYRRADVEIILKIKNLLYGKGFTIAGAKAALAEHPQSEQKHVEKNILNQLIGELKKIRDILTFF